MSKRYFIFIVLILLSLVTSCNSTLDKNSVEDLEVINYSVTYKQNVSNVTLEYGFLESNLKIDNFFIRCDGVSRFVNFSEQYFNDNFLYQWKTTLFTREFYVNENITKTVEFYAEFNGVILLLDSQEINFVEYVGYSPVKLPNASKGLI